MEPRRETLADTEVSMSSIAVGMILGFAFYCCFCIYKPEFLASTYFIREQYGFKIRLFFRLLASIWGLGALWWAIQQYSQPDPAWGTERPNLFIAGGIGIGLSFLCFVLVRWGRRRKLKRKA